MTPAERRRFARHVSLAEIGEAGQERLSATVVRAEDGTDPRVARWAEEHASRSGARVGADGVAIVSATPGDVREVAGRPDLDEVAAFFLGALGALEHVRRTTLGPGTPPIGPFVLAPPASPGARREGPAR